MNVISISDDLAMLTSQKSMENSDFVLQEHQKKLDPMGLDRVENCVTDVIEKTLLSIFKDEGARVILGYVEKKYNLGCGDLINRCEVFSVGLNELLDSAGPVIEKIILKKLFEELRHPFLEKKTYCFSDYISDLIKETEKKRFMTLRDYK